MYVVWCYFDVKSVAKPNINIIIRYDTVEYIYIRDIRDRIYIKDKLLDDIINY